MSSTLDNEGFNDPNCIDAGGWITDGSFTDPSNILICNYGSIGTQTGLDIFDISDDCSLTTLTHETYEFT